MKTFENDAVIMGMPAADQGAAALSGLCHLITDQNLADIRQAVSDVKSDIRESIQNLGISNNVNFRALENRICEVEKSAIIFAKDATITSLQVEGRLTNRITDFERNVDENFCEVKREIMGVNFNMEKMNTHLTHLIDKTKFDLSLQMERGFSKVEVDELKEALRREREHRDEARFASIHSLINSVELNQRQGSKVVQFGTGNLATPTNTNNQNQA